MKKLLKKIGKGIAFSANIAWQNKRNIGIMATTFILPAINAYFPDMMTPEQFKLWDNAAKALATGGVLQNVYKHEKRRRAQKHGTESNRIITTGDASTNKN